MKSKVDELGVDDINGEVICTCCNRNQRKIQLCSCKWCKKIHDQEFLRFSFSYRKNLNRIELLKQF